MERTATHDSRSTEPLVTPIRARADEIFERVSPYPGFGFRNHCRRLWHFTCMLMEREGIEFDQDVAYLVAMLHDLGIVSEQDEGHCWPQRSRALFERETRDLELGVDQELLTECLVYNHRVLKVPNLKPAAECFRKAVWIEHARGFRSYGLDQSKVRSIYQEYPRGNFDRVLLDFTWRVLRREPLTIINGIFF